MAPPAAWVWTPQGGTLAEQADSVILWVGSRQDGALATELQDLARELHYDARPATDNDFRQSWPVAFVEQGAIVKGSLEPELAVITRTVGHPAVVRLAVEVLATDVYVGGSAQAFGASWVDTAL